MKDVAEWLVSDSTRQAVITALDVLGYERPTELRQRSAGLVGLVVPELENSIFPAFVQVIEDAPFIAADDHVAMDIAIAHLAHLGHRKVGLAIGPARFMPSARKHVGFVTALATSRSSASTTRPWSRSSTRRSPPCGSRWPRWVAPRSRRSPTRSVATRWRRGSTCSHPSLVMRASTGPAPGRATP